jgi:hypothetical protein
MDARFSRLLDAFRRVNGDAPTGLADALRRLPDVGALPSPWETWTLIGLVRHRERQHWVADIVRTRLSGDPSALAALSAFGHPDGVPQQGPVPGLPEWEYYFHGRGRCLTHQVDGDAIDVDLFGDTADYFDTFFYKYYLECRPRGAADRGVRGPVPGGARDKRTVVADP